MTKPKFIVISGQKQTGKSTIGNFLYKNLCQHLYKNTRGFDYEYPTNYIIQTSFAEPLKQFCSNVFGINEEDMETEEGKQKLTHIKWSDLYRAALIQDDYDRKTGYMTVREVLQYLGSNILRNRFWNDIWASCPFNKSWCQDYVIITDARFKNEIDIARANNAIIIRVSRDSAPKDNHISEQALNNEDWSKDIQIFNNGTLEDLKHSIDKLMPQITGWMS